MIYNAYFRDITPDGCKSVVDIYDSNLHNIETVVHIPFNQIFILSRSSIMLPADYDSIHKHYASVDIPNINKVSAIRIITLLNAI